MQDLTRHLKAASNAVADNPALRRSEVHQRAAKSAQRELQAAASDLEASRVGPGKESDLEVQYTPEHPLPD